MSRGKPLQAGVRAKLANGTTWDSLAQMTPDQIRDKNAFPAGFMPLPHANHPEGGMIFPKFHIDAIKKEKFTSANDNLQSVRARRKVPVR